MGFYVRKSVKAGPFRFNVSKSGLGVSAGVPGFRVGTGPRGNYVSIKGTGVHYSTTSATRPERVSRPETPASGDESSANVMMRDTTGAASMSLAPTGGGDVVQQLNEAAGRHGWGWPVAITAALVGLFTLPYGLIVWFIAVPACWWLFLRDRARSTVVLFYDVNDGTAAWFDALVANWESVSGAQRTWREVQSGRVSTTYQHKTNAGASSVVERVSGAASLAGPKHLATNVAVPSIAAGKSSLHFLPDRVLLRDRKHYTDISYRYLETEGYQQRFVEKPGQLPNDAQQVGQTWQYVNVNGGPDRRFSNNPILPIMQYGNVHLTSPHGLDWRLQISRADAAPVIAKTLGAVPAVDEST